MHRPVSLLASAALALPLVAVAAPAEAGDVRSGDRITNCSKTRYGVTVRIKLRDNGEFTRVRVSHPRGEGNFFNPKVRRAPGSALYGGGGAIGRFPFPDAPSQRIKSSRSGGALPLGLVAVTFQLRNGKAIRLECEVR